MKSLKSFAPLMGLAAVAATASAADGNTRPNVVFIYADDLGYADLSCYGETRWKTGQLDRLAEEGVRFTDFYSASPLSSPSRAGLMTGRYPCRSGVQRVFHPGSYTGMPQSEVTIAEMLKDVGYATCHIGKWHLGSRERYLPLQQGFDEYFGIPYSTDMPDQVYFRGNDVVDFNPDLNQMVKTYTAEAVDFIERNADNPFFLYFAHNLMHVPIVASEEFRGKSGAGIYGDAMLEFDWSVGEVMKTLERLGLEENTIVIFSSDNGPWLQEGPLGGTALPLREGKGTDYDGGVRVPCIAYWKGHFKAATDATVANMLDWFPTLANLCGAELPEGVRLDGHDISSVLYGTGERENQDYAYFRNNREVTAYRSGDWKISLPANAIGGNYWRNSTAKRDTMLVNLREDIGETTNLYYRYPAKAKEMIRKLDKYKKEFGEIPPALVIKNGTWQPYLNAERKRVIDESKARGIKSKKDDVLGFDIPRP